MTYDVQSDQAIRLIHVAGTLTMARDKDTRLDVGLISIQTGDQASEEGFDCDAHLDEPDPNVPRPPWRSARLSFPSTRNTRPSSVWSIFRA